MSQSLIALACLLGAAAAQAQILRPSSHLGGVGLNRYGSSGYITIPTADIAPAGSFDFAINRAYDPIFDLRGAPPGGNLVFVATPYENFEIGGRLAEYTKVDPVSHLITQGSRDLSGNVKFQLVRMPHRDMRVAFGVQDVGGGAVALRGVYGVFTMDMGPLSASGGYIKRDSRGRSGGFAGAKLALIEPVYVMADVDPYQKAIGARATLPLKFLPGKPDLSGTVSRSSPRFAANTRPKTDVQVAMRFALAPQSNGYMPSMGRKADEAQEAPQWPQNTTAPQPQADAAVQLRALGFDAVTVRSEGEHARVVLQNSAYKHSHYDGLAVALTSLTKTLPASVKDIFIVLRAQGVPVAEVYANRTAWQTFVRGGAVPAMGRDLRITNAAGQAHQRLAGSVGLRSSAPVTLRIDPVIRSFWGTDFGAAEVAASARATAIAELLPLAGGQVLASIAVTSSAAKTDAFQTGRGFQGQEPASGLTSAMVHWAGWTGRDLFHLVSVGKNDKHFQGAAIESHWVNRKLPLGVDGTLSLRAGSFKADGVDPSTNRPLADREYLRVNASGFIPAADLHVNLGAGQFLAGDRGPSVDVSRDFGDVSFGVTYRKTDRHFFGIQMGLPLTPRKGLARIGPVQIEGSNHFMHGARTSYLGKRRENAVIPAAARFADLPIDAQLHWFDRGRLNAAQWSQNLFSSREFANTVLAEAK